MFSDRKAKVLLVPVPVLAHDLDQSRGPDHRPQPMWDPKRKQNRKSKPGADLAADPDRRALRRIRLDPDLLDRRALKRKRAARTRFLIQFRLPVIPLRAPPKPVRGLLLLKIKIVSLKTSRWSRTDIFRKQNCEILKSRFSSKNL